MRYRAEWHSFMGKFQRGMVQYHMLFIGRYQCCVERYRILFMGRYQCGMEWYRFLPHGPTRHWKASKVFGQTAGEGNPF